MPKTHRIEVRLTEEDHALLMDRAQDFGRSITETIEWFLHTLRPAAIIGIYPVGRRGCISFSVRFSNGMVVHGFLWSRGGQLLAPRHWAGNHWVLHMNGPRTFWSAVRQMCLEHFSRPAQVE